MAAPRAGAEPNLVLSLLRVGASAAHLEPAESRGRDLDVRWISTRGLPFAAHSGKRTSPSRGEPQPMGKRDRRHSLKMNRRKAQVKKKLRAKRPKATRAVEGAAPVKK